MDRQSPRFTWPEYMAAFVCLLLVLRVLFADAFRLYERELLGSLGLDGAPNLLVGLAVVALVVYWRLRRRRWAAETETGAAPRWLSIVDMAVILAGAGAVVWMAVA